MKAFVINRYKDPLREADVPEPALGDRDVLVQVKAASANQLDEKIRLGEFKQILPYWLPLILGNDLPALLLPSGLSCGRSGPGTRCMPGPTRTGSAPSRSASRSPKPILLSRLLQPAWGLGEIPSAFHKARNRKRDGQCRHRRC